MKAPINKIKPKATTEKQRGVSMKAMPNQGKDSHSSQLDYIKDEHMSELDEIANSSMESPLQRIANPVEEEEARQPKIKNNTLMPDNLKMGIENLSGYSMDDVKVHYNSARPAQLKAHAYAQGTDIHLASGHEKHLHHEAWHVVQQKQGRVQPTMQMKGGVSVNDDKGLEKEADVMGKQVTGYREINHLTKKNEGKAISNLFQAKAVLQTKKSDDFDYNRSSPTKLGVKYLVYKGKDGQEKSDAIALIINQSYETYLGKGTGYYNGLQDKIQRYNSDEEKQALISELAAKRKVFDNKYKKYYNSRISDFDANSQTTVSSWGKKYRHSKTSGPAPYSNHMLLDEDRIIAAHNYAERDPARIRDQEKKNNEKGLPNSEVIWNQYKDSIVSRYSGRENKKADTGEKLKNLKKISRVQVANRFTKQTAYKALPDNKIDFTQSHVWKADTEEFLALLGTPNCSGPAFMLADHVDELEGKSIKNVELVGDANDLNIDINFTD